jgi:hypothetical protein
VTTPLPSQGGALSYFFPPSILIVLRVPTFTVLLGPSTATVPDAVSSPTTPTINRMNRILYTPICGHVAFRPRNRKNGMVSPSASFASLTLPTATFALSWAAGGIFNPQGCAPSRRGFPLLSPSWDRLRRHPVLERRIAEEGTGQQRVDILSDHSPFFCLHR